MSRKLILKCPHCHKILYELEEYESFIAAGMCRYCKGLTVFNSKKSIFEKDLEQES